MRRQEEREATRQDIQIRPRRHVAPTERMVMVEEAVAAHALQEHAAGTEAVSRSLVKKEAAPRRISHNTLQQQAHCAKMASILRLESNSVGNLSMSLQHWMTTTPVPAFDNGSAAASSSDVTDSDPWTSICLLSSFADLAVYSTTDLVG